MSTNINYDVLSDIEFERLYKEAMKPYWAERLVKEDENGYHIVGAVLPTKDGRRHGNATIISVVNDIKNFVRIITVMTDAGNLIRMTDEEIERGFYPPKYIRKQGVIETK